jgi:hypothetical protein
MNGLMHRSKQHSITLSTRRTNDEDTSTPIALALCWLCDAQQLDELPDQHLSIELHVARATLLCCYNGLRYREIFLRHAMQRNVDLIMHPGIVALPQRPQLALGCLYVVPKMEPIALRLPIGVFCCRSFVRRIEKVEAPPSLSSLCVLVAESGPSSVVLRHHLRV